MASTPQEEEPAEVIQELVAALVRAAEFHAMLTESFAQIQLKPRTDDGAAEVAVEAMDAAGTSAAAEVAKGVVEVASKPQEEGEGQTPDSIDEATAQKLLGDGFDCVAFEQLAQDGRAQRETFVREFASQLAEQASQACLRGDDAALMELLASGMDANHVDDDGYPPLCTAASYGESKCLAMLLEQVTEIDVNQVETTLGRTPLYCAVELGHAECMTLLLARPDIDVNKARTDDSFTPLLMAARAGHTEVVRLLLTNPQTDVNQAEAQGWTPLYVASMNGHAECVTLLLARPDIDVNKARTSDLLTPLIIAVNKGHTEVVALLLAHSQTDVNQGDKLGRPPLCMAAKNNQADCVPILLAATGIDVNRAAMGVVAGTTPLIQASRTSSTMAALALLADPRIAVDAKDDDGKAAISYAVHTDNAQLAAALIARGADVSPAFPDPLLAACAVGDACKARVLLLQRQPAVGADMLPPLVRACLVGTPAEVAALDLSTACDADGHMPPPLALAVEVSGARGDEGDALVRALVDGMGGVDGQQQRDALLAAAAAAAAKPASAPAGSAYGAFVLALIEKGLLDAPGLACKAAKAIVLAYIGSIAASAHMAAVEGAFDELKAVCKRRLEHIAAPLEDVCTTQGLCALLGSVGAAVGSRPVALDHPQLLPMPKYIMGALPANRAYEPYLIQLINMASLALDELFVERVVAALTPFGDGVVNDGVLKVNDGKGTIRIIKGGQPLIDITRVPVKSYVRMNTKLESADDHMHKELPRPKWNIDSIRLSVVVYDPKQIAAVYETINARVGAVIRTKNAFAMGSQVNYGYRAILSNLRFESGLTVREVFGGAHRAKWMALGRARMAIHGQASWRVRAVLEAVLADSGVDWEDEANASLPDAPLNIAAEVQLIYEPYLSKGRKLSHLPYKVLRCASVAVLARDAGGKTQSARLHEAVHAAERVCMAIAPAELRAKGVERSDK